MVRTDLDAYAGMVQEDGRYQIEIQGRPLQLAAWAPGCAPEFQDLTRDGLNLKNISLTLKPAFGSLTMQIVGPDESPLPGVRVLAVPGWMEGPRRKECLTWYGVVSGPHGEVSLRQVYPGPNEILVWAKGFYLREPVRIGMAGQGSSPGKIKLNRCFEVTGRIRFPEGCSSTSSLVYVTRENAALSSLPVDPEGYFRASDLPPGRYSFRPAGPGLVPEKAETFLLEKSRSIELALLPQTHLCVQTAPPREGVWLQLEEVRSSGPRTGMSGDGTDPERVSWIMTDAQGRATWKGLKPEPYCLKVSSSDPLGDDPDGLPPGNLPYYLRPVDLRAEWTRPAGLGASFPSTLANSRAKRRFPAGSFCAIRFPLDQETAPK